MKKSILFLVLAFLTIGQSYAQGNGPATFIGTNLARGNNLRVLRLAVSTTGEFTQQNGGQTATAALIGPWLAQINEVYGREYCVQFELIPNNNLLIYTNPATDPWATLPDGSGGCDNADLILDRQGTVIDSVIGSANYDISHVIAGAPFGGGCAGWFKGGVSGGFDIPVTRHEMGHQFSQPHTINRGAGNYEPENAGRSIHGGNTDGIAHSSSYHALANHLLTTEANAGTKVATGNTIPTVNAGVNQTIPHSTPFMLTGTATDPDAGDVLTYVWDQLDGAPAQNLPIANDLQGALFSRLVPTTANTRTYPMISSILARDFSNAVEDLPTQARDLNFRLTVYDGHNFNYNGTVINANGINSDDIKVTVASSGPFEVTSQNATGIIYTGGTAQTVSWDVNGTNTAPINTSQVKISLSTNGGLTYPIVLTNSTNNTGTANVVMPNINTTQARIKVEAVGNIYFAINEENFTINQNATLPGINIVLTGLTTLVSETGQSDTYNISLLTTPAGSVTVTIDADAQSEISLDGTNYSTSLNVVLNNTTAQTIHVRGKFDNIAEGGHLGTITQVVSATGDNANYPIGLLGQPVTANIADAQIPPVVGIDFDEVSSTDTPNEWIKISDARDQSLMNIPLDDGTPTTIDLTTTAADCGIGGCSFGSGVSNLPQHIQSLTPISGVIYTRTATSFTWSGLKANTNYRIFVFGRGEFGPMAQTITITGSGTPIVFTQNATPGTILINDQVSSSGQALLNFGKEIISTGNGTIVISCTSQLENNEMSFHGLAIQEVLSNPNIILPGFGIAGCGETANFSVTDANISNGSNVFRTNGTITTNGTVTVGAADGEVAFRSGSSITLLPGFEAQVGSSFLATIESCTATLQEEEPTAKLTKVSIAPEQPSIKNEVDLKIMPNPFANETQFSFNLEKEGLVTIQVYNFSGQLVDRVTQNQWMPSGLNKVIYQANGLQAGMFYVVFQIGKTIQTKKMIISK